MELVREAQVLDIGYRQRVIAEINSPENKERKKESFKRHRIYRDKTKDYVIQKFKEEMGDNTVKDIINRVSNISICKKIINKKAMVYKDGVYRKCSDQYQPALDILENELELNSTMKKVNTTVELQNNMALQVKAFAEEDINKYEVSLNVLPPYLYDVLEDANEKSCPKGVVYSIYIGEEMSIVRSTSNADGYRNHNIATEMELPQQPIMFVWWTKNYHFTTDAKGEVIQGEGYGDGANPIKKLPFVFFAKNQDDDQYWSLGGDDIIDGSVDVNLLLTDMYYIAKFQGMGFFYAFGKNLPKEFKVGPREGITIEMQQGDPTPQVGFASPSAPIDQHISMIEQKLALILSTNNLKAKEISGTLSGGDVESGIAKVIDRSENMDDVEDQREQYRDKEPEIIELALTWIEYLRSKKILVDDLMPVDMPIDEPVTIKFADPMPVMTEKEKLEVMQMRKDLGLDTEKDLLKKDNPDLTDEEIDAKMQTLDDSKEIQEQVAEKVETNEMPDDNMTDMQMD